MSSKQEERQQAAYRAALDKLLQEPANKFCSDCASSGPRWASPKLGVFICMKCAGIHRGLGVHISFVRSVTLDKWKESEVDEMNPGNSKAASIYEATLPDNFPRPSADGAALEKFIRNKYVYKRYMLANGEAKPQAKPEPAKPVVQQQQPRAPSVAPVLQPPARYQQPVAVPAPTAKPVNLLGDIFAPIQQPVVAPTPSVASSFSQAQSAPVQNLTPQEAAKNDIMNLFQTQQTQFPQQQQYQYTPQQYQMAQMAQAQQMAQMAQAQQMAQYGNFYQQQPQWPAVAPQQDTSGLEILSKIQSISQPSGQVYF